MTGITVTHADARFEDEDDAAIVKRKYVSGYSDSTKSDEYRFVKRDREVWEFVESREHGNGGDYTIEPPKSVLNHLIREEGVETVFSSDGERKLVSIEYDLKDQSN